MIFNTAIVMISVFFLAIVLLIVFRMLQHRFFLSSLFDALQKRHSETGIKNAFFYNRLNFSTQIMDVCVYMITGGLLRPIGTRIRVSMQNKKIPFDVCITTHAPREQHYVVIGQKKGQRQFIAESKASLDEIKKIITSPVLDILMEVLMVESCGKKEHDINIQVQENSVLVDISHRVKDPRHLQLLTECTQGLARELCREEHHVQQAEKAPEKNAVFSRLYLRHTVLLLTAFALFLVIQIAVFFYRSRNFYEKDIYFSGTVVKKMQVSNTFYFFIPQKIRVTRDDFSRISEGSFIEKKKGKKEIILLDEEEAEIQEDKYLDLLN